MIKMDKKTLAGQMYWKHAKSEEAAPENPMSILYTWIFQSPSNRRLSREALTCLQVYVFLLLFKWYNLSQTLKIKSQETTIQFHRSPDTPQCFRMNIRTHSGNSGETL